MPYSVLTGERQFLHVHNRLISYVKLLVVTSRSLWPGRSVLGTMAKLHIISHPSRQRRSCEDVGRD